MPHFEAVVLPRSAPQEASYPAPTSAGFKRPRVQGKFLYVGDEKLWVRGVTYGPFHSKRNSEEGYDRAVVERDFARMAANLVNAIRTYTVPPRWLLDAAWRHGLRVMVGIPWEEHVAFLDDPHRVRSIEARVRAGVRACAGHPAVLCYAVGNEIPAPIVRWHGRRRMERFIERLYRAAKTEDPDALVTYVNYPTTEYLQLPFLDLLGFNVYLESQERLEAYLARLQNIAGDRPLVMAEVGLDSRRHGEDAQARMLDWQVRTSFAAGCGGVFVFAWTDEWYRGGFDIEDWDFGLTRRDRHPKAALDAVRTAFAEVPFPKRMPWPRVSVIVCTRNGQRTIRDCLEGLQRLKYPDFEVVIVDDGSIDRTATIVSKYDFRLIRTENRGLSNARNLGLEAASGEIVAYIDDDAWPDPHWLFYRAAAFLKTNQVGVGGPNIPPPGDGPIADCVANAPGAPAHVLLSDGEAEHIPGCNMAFRKAALQAIGGFDSQVRVAGDDVDVCWRLQDRGGTLGFHPAAMVWHHRRSSVRAYWKQQKGYGKAEALLERKWPEKYNAAGHPAWAGRLYGPGLLQKLSIRRQRIYHGTWGSATFQRMYQPAPDGLSCLMLIPEWYLVILTLGVLSTLGSLWRPLLFALPLLASAVGATIVRAGLGGARASFSTVPSSRMARLGMRGMTAFLHLSYPLVRLIGRLRHGLTPWRRRGMLPLALPWRWAWAIWSERWKAPADRLQFLEDALGAAGAVTRRGGDFDHWDLEVQGGLLGAARILMGVEEHGAGRQLVRFRSWPRCSPVGVILTLVLGFLSVGAAFGRSWIACGALGVGAEILAIGIIRDCATAMAVALHAGNFLTRGKV